LLALRESLSPVDRRARKQELDALFYRANRYRYSVGAIVMSLFFEIKGSGDTWEQAFAEADEKEKRWRAA
jgi:hypothetical protein